MKKLNICIITFFVISLTSCSKEDEPTLNKPGEDPSQPSIENTQINGHEYVDLGLSIYWSTCNLGAKNSYEYGDFFAWGETSSKDYFSEKNYEYYKSGNYINIGSNISGTKYDAARSQWGSSWRIPTKAEFDELENKCKKEICYINGIKGCKYIGPNGNSVFFPYAGWKMYDATSDKGVGFIYWASTKENIRAYIDIFEQETSILGIRYLGFTIKPVSDKY